MEVVKDELTSLAFAILEKHVAHEKAARGKKAERYQRELKRGLHSGVVTGTKEISTEPPA
jgi:hypothetical protein